MRVLIAYRTKYGATAACARMLAERIQAETSLADLALERRPDLRAAEAVLIGGSIYGGKIQREIGAFCERERDLLLERKVGLFICCLYRDGRAQAELGAAFPEWLSSRAFRRDWFGGELHPDSLTLFDRILVRGIRPQARDLALLRADAIADFAASVNAL